MAEDVCHVLSLYLVGPRLVLVCPSILTPYGFGRGGGGSLR